MTTAKNYLRSLSVETIRLEAVPEAVALYQRLGFKGEFASLRFCRKWKHEKVQLKGKIEKIYQIKSTELEDLAKFDAKCFGANRLKVLRESLQRFSSALPNCERRNHIWVHHGQKNKYGLLARSLSMRRRTSRGSTEAYCFIHGNPKSGF